MRKILCSMIVLCCTFILCAYGHEHTWVDATCTEPKTCSECGETEGEPLGHDTLPATYLEPETCIRCGATFGNVLPSKKIANENGYKLPCIEIINAYNDLMDGQDPCYSTADQTLKIRVEEAFKNYYDGTISVRKSTNQFAVWFTKNDDIISDFYSESIPDQITVWTRGRKELVDQDDSLNMLPEILSAFVFLCEDDIIDSEAAYQRAEEIMIKCKSTHDWVQSTAFDYYCAANSIKGYEEGSTAINMLIVIKNHGVPTSFQPS